MPTHKKPESERFRGPVKYLEYLVARALVTTLQRLPIRFAYRLGRAVAVLFAKTSKSSMPGWTRGRRAETSVGLRAET